MTEIKNLPQWNLNDFYSAYDAPELAKDLENLSARAKEFEKKYSGKITSISGDELCVAIKEYEGLSEAAGKIGSYAYLLFSTNMDRPEITAFFQNTSEKINDATTHTLFFTLDINKISDGDLNEKLQSKNLQHYRSWIRDVRVMKPYQLSDEVEKTLHEKYVVGRQAWVRLFDETLSGLTFKIDGKKLTTADAFNLLSDKDGDKRKKAAREISKVLNNNAKTFALVTNTLAKEKQIEDGWRKFKKPISSRNVANFLEDDVVDALIKSVSANYEKLAHRYYAYKAKAFGVEKLNYWDRNAPYPADLDKTFAWDEAKELVLEAYEKFSPRMAKIGAQFFDKNWIDAAPKAGKESGAYSHPTVPSVHPYIMMNFHGKVRDVMTLAHELGHGVHQELSKAHGALMADTPLTLAETASVFGEQLAFRELLAREKDAAKKRMIIAGKVEDMLNTVVRQIAFCQFEIKLHDARRKGELSPEEIGKIWMSVQKKSLGGAIKLTKPYNIYWSYISHFVHSPFYVYAYAFGDLLVNALYGVYQKGHPNFEEKYITMLKAGGTLHHKDLLAPFGLDASQPTFWQTGIDVISGLVDELVG